MDSAAALKHNGYKFISWLAGHLGKGSVHWGCKFFESIQDLAAMLDKR